MKLLLDQGLPRSTVASLALVEIESIHVSEAGLSEASDSRVLEYARNNALVVVSLDADFHALMAISGSDNPSVVRIREEGLKADDLAQLLHGVLDRCGEQLEKGALVSVTTRRLRIRTLPLAR
jgi:predicted nuclease of predicted toxin-antitoxin system